MRKPEVTADIYYSGVTLTGGGALLSGMAERLQNDLNYGVSVPEDPLTTVALGAGRLLKILKIATSIAAAGCSRLEDAEKLGGYLVNGKVQHRLSVCGLRQLSTGRKSVPQRRSEMKAT